MKKQPRSEITNADPENLKLKRTTVNAAGKIPIVGIGASAGGLEALEQFFAKMPVNSGMAFVVIQHLDPNHKGIMTELLQRVTGMKVQTVTDRLKIKPNCVYVIPANKSMSVLNGSLHLFVPVETRGLRLPIDFFFRSLADDLGAKSIGIILSGMGSDGTLGLTAIKEKEGTVMVQDPTSAKFDSMPRSAIDNVLIDIVAPADELPAKLMAISKQNLPLSNKLVLEKDVSSLEKIVILLRTKTGNDFSQYKKNTVYRRIERRMGIHQINKIGSYVRYLQDNSNEIDILFKELLIGVTSFFRDTLLWEEIKEKIMPSLIEKLPQKYILRVWIPGCSTGEEAFSLAMVFKEAMEKANHGKNILLQAFATDIDNTAIEKARKAIYPRSIVADVSPDRLSRFFTKVNDQYRVNKEIRDMVVFAPQNVIKDPPFTKLDIISCRNLLIYLDAGLQKKLLTLFHYSLNPGGILLLGSAETNGTQNELFSVINSKLRIYRSLGSSKTEELYDFPSSFSRYKLGKVEDQTPANIPNNIQFFTDQLLLQQFSPSSVLVTNLGDILYITGSTGKYLEPAAGKANMNIFAMAREGLSDELPLVFHKATKSYDKVVLHNLKMGSNNEVRYADVTIQQIEKPPQLKGRILIVFADVPIVNHVSTELKTGKGLKRTFHSELELDLQHKKEDLQSLREEMQTSQEELKSTNEELQSTNEELQSTNEELTTSKEEMQSLNEELHTVNIELQNRIEDSVRLNNDMSNLLGSIEIATLFLDKNLKIRQFTHQATKIFKLRQSDVGRLFTDQVTDLDYPDLYRDASEVLHTLIILEKAVETHDGRWFSIRIMPYRTNDDKIDGLVITFIDITRSKQQEMILRESQLTLKSFISVVPGVIIGLSSEGIIIEYNPEAEKLFGHKLNDVIGKNYVDLFIPEPSRKQVLADMTKLLNGKLPNRYKNIVRAVNGDTLQIEWSAHKLLDDKGVLMGTINIGINITKP